MLTMLALGLLAAVGAGAAQEDSAATIAAAVLAAPEELRDGASVLGWDAEGKETVELRAGSNDLVCLADKPGDEAFSVACYHRALEPYMRRGREMAAEGISGETRMKQRWQEIDDGKLKMPDVPATLYVLTGKSYDPATGEVADRYLRYVVYTPYATPESTGLALSPSGPGAPWLMFPGTAGAHIMINPPKSAPEPPAAPTPPPPATPPPVPAASPPGGAGSAPGLE
jgi:hypothetical protein